jgi:hypothetical protein
MIWSVAVGRLKLQPSPKAASAPARGTDPSHGGWSAPASAGGAGFRPCLFFGAWAFRPRRRQALEREPR